MSRIKRQSASMVRLPDGGTQLALEKASPVNADDGTKPFTFVKNGWSPNETCIQREAS